MQVKCSHRLALMCAATCVQQPLFLLLGKGGKDLVLLLEYYYYFFYVHCLLLTHMRAGLHHGAFI